MSKDRATDRLESDREHHMGTHVQDFREVTSESDLMEKGALQGDSGRGASLRRPDSTRCLSPCGAGTVRVLALGAGCGAGGRRRVVPACVPWGSHACVQQLWNLSCEGRPTGL